MRALITYFIIFMMFSLTPWAFYTLGQKQASYSIAKQCALDNTFTEHGNEFYCQDQDDYHAD